MIISIFSPKGGVGKTTIALALSKTASKKLKTCTIEFDFSPGDFVSILDLDRKKNILEAVNGNLDWAVQRPIKQNFDVIVGGYPDAYEMIKPDKLRKMMEELNTRYELVIIDIQPAFVEGCIDIFDMSKDILFIVEDDVSVNSRAVGNIDWARANGFIDLRKIKIIVNKLKTRELKYVNITELKLPVIYKVPYIKNLGSFENPKMLKHAENILNVLYPNIFHEERKGFLFFKKKQPEQIPAELSNTGEVPKETELSSAAENVPIENHEPETAEEVKRGQERIPEKRGELYPMKVYVNTGYKELDDIFKTKFETVDSLAGCDAAVISYISNKDYIRSLISAGKKIILLAGDSDYSLVEAAKEIGIKDIYRSPIDPQEIIDNLINDKGGKNMLGEKVGLEIEIPEQNQPEAFETIEKQEDALKYDSENEINTVLNEIKNILAKNKEVYERRISMQEEIIRQKEEEIKELQKTIEEYKEKEEKRKKVLMELQNLLQ
ncbi:hypothetical protein O163_10010 [Caldanaerobacter subterraneus subsp. yonseiensis KB-1]|uniref:CobQ/CobB/MinD/ParA nucleotide binding domain-containing protein n=1 Tax=Caldanaerobacter subterraneus subsp. yonseiensis KB-1 TaxID=1388761 RepID=U5CF10_CALSX|nr:AAA family ATPase [Caldanaerobacter subterraneus]ERM91500.1 hypothetical protein O163_10010 [Caldanaerobacter subterraneus subsp. yonseiensis KB-1]